MTKKENEMLAVLVERVDTVKRDTEEIKKHQQYQNGKLAEATLAIEKAREIAKSADVKAEEAKACAKSTEGELGKLRIIVVAAIALLIGGGVLTGFGISSLVGG
jgi:SMC interacting uncharacterized protein involved in chromosome segregation